MTAPVITIDGPGGSGKGTLALRLARSLGWHLLDSGALYRLVALAAQHQSCAASDVAGLARIAATMDVVFQPLEQGTRILLDGNDVSRELRSETIAKAASEVAAHPQVRSSLIDRQRAFRQPPGLVADGRDMGTVIFPDASLKIYLTASVEERARRRYKQLKEKGESVNLPRLSREIEARDERDMNRPVAPLRPAPDAHRIDSSELSIDQVLQQVQNLVKENQITY